MKNILAALFFALALSLPLSTQAHDLVPKQLTDYLAEHPGATSQEILEYANEQTPEYAEKFKDGAAILEIVRDRQSSFLDNLFDFFRLGVKHILSGPDHILFVLSLLLVFVSWKHILRITATFTVAHSITLILAGTGIVVLSPRIVEPVIALSIAYVAITSVFFRRTAFVGGDKGKMGAVFFFGLFHGLGFAGLLREIQIPQDKFVSSLFAFNVGIEAGQLLIVLTAFPFIYFFRHRRWYPTAIRVFAVLIALISIGWFVQRIVA